MTTRSFAQVVGIVFILIGAIGFFPGMKSAPPPGIPHLAVDGGYGLLLGLFPVNWLHNLIHLGIGIAAWSSSQDHDSARQFLRGLTFVYGALAVMGLIPVLNMAFGFIPLYGHDVWLHASLAAMAAYFGFGQRMEPVEARENCRHAA